jgi:hypothetical protein
MALIKSTLLAQISGSINGATFSHNKGGAYVRNRSLPSNPGTDRQDQVRTALTSLSKMWAESLTDAQRELWRLYGGAITVLNRIGDPIHLSGIASFNRVNLFRMATLGLEPVLTPPEGGTGSETPIPSFTSAAFTNNDGTITVTLTVTGVVDDPPGWGAVCYFSGPLSPGVRYYRGPYSGFQMMNPVGLGGSSFTTNLPATYAAGQYVGLKLILFNDTDDLKVWEVFVDPQVIPADTP